ncbi:MAG: 3-oxoacyl-[acyl-carrier-protein] reductase [Spirochaetes bacterium GWF1_31_7]|nr:MAG: 3-oxoacyl-[acyl-carrier-protein] reductase [Spirochaetes bacterium GWE1_32_154]OHD48810.1 MAG: 3-oxoacyl-[acyl-carrier-protein] reductase [Spirochaetes bacterium GWE2_31_10]OHD52872.1 MAG: 3-oxoacyl-[acyl-carrier-protein] reductase [Spirochaetes bacterium GWF1_31_7]OHD82064.1 MAG: 3-oxoacyl-[acyl-carrier-protein] reductase [Spirochaetes bacterium RIFOXYB1_FULL_32_8]HBD94674.1 3-oxoacyl-[acyl-carrier-protein] reductase [Spirochaetia bacterium]
MNFKDKIALVTGASRGIGRAIAETFAAGGAKLIITATSNAIETVAKEIGSQFGVEVISFYGDISDENVVKSLFKTIAEKFGRLDICVNNAGITKDGLSMRMSADDFDAVINVNLRSVFLVSKEAALMMMKEKYGKIVNMSSIVGVRGNAGQANYAASKAGIIGITKSMAVELAKRNITINAIAPGFIDTDMTKAISDKAKEEFMKLIPMERAGSAQDIANAVAFFASDMSKYITGQTLVVDGGLLLK